MPIEKGKPVHCREASTGDGLTGTLLISEKELRVKIFNYNEPFHIKINAPVHLVAETGDVVSLHDCIRGGSGTQGGYECYVSSENIIANIAVVGPDRWTDIDRIRRVYFSVRHTMELLYNHKRIKGIDRNRYSDKNYHEIFREKMSKMIIGAHYSGIWGADFNSPKKLWPVFEIEFDEPQDIHQFSEYVKIYVDFLSFCLGVPLRPSEIKIDRLSFAEMIQSVEEQTYRSPHEVHYIWPEMEIHPRDCWAGGSPVCAYDDEELSAFRACLIAWMNRADMWRKPYVLMRLCLKRKDEMSAERLISACRWFEELPNAQSQNALSSENAEAIVAAAVSRAIELGHADVCDRIATSIARIKEETAADRFGRLIALLQDKFGEDVLPKHASLHLRKAIQFRGRIAHGHFNPKSDEEYSAFAKATYAMEALCVLLTAVDLPISKAAIGRIQDNRLVRDYRTANE